MAMFMGVSVCFCDEPNLPSPSFFSFGSVIDMWRDSDEAREGGPDLCGVLAVLAAGTSGVSLVAAVPVVKLPKS
jgi:hypothetical protein